MEQNYTFSPETAVSEPLKRKILRGPYINIILFLLTFLSTTIAGVMWLNIDPYDFRNFPKGLTYSILILSFLSAHEFGHYFAAKIHKVKVTLPYYIPFPFPFLNPFGTMGAVIRLRSQARSRRELFDIGVAGPIAGFIVTVGILVWGLTHLPPVEYIYTIHPEYQFTGIPTSGFSFGQNILYWGLSKILTSSPDVFLPPMNEMYHYPFLCVGWFGLFVTSLNLLPVGQLDGGHILYSMLGEKHKIVVRIFFGLVVLMGLVGLLPWLGINFLPDYSLSNWIIWALLILFVIKIEHPPIFNPEPLDTKRYLWGVFAIIMFILCFTPVPITNF